MAEAGHRAFVRPVVATVVGLVLGVAVTALAGENPLTVLRVILVGAFGSPYDLGMTLFYATPLILTGLAVAIPFHAGLFNIGGEGQLTVGALAAALVGILAPGLAWPLAIPLAAAAAFAAGAAWGLVPGWIKAYRGGHEVITTIMLNAVASGLTSWVTLYLVHSTESQNPETAKVGDGYLLARFGFFDGAPVSMALPLALAAALCVWIFLGRRVRGYETRVVGANPDAAGVAGIDVRRTQLLAMALAGGVAGLVGVAEVLGNAGRFRMGFSAEYGFVGIPVALLARSHPLGLVVSAVLFGALQKGTAELELDVDITHVTRDLSAIIQAMVVLAVSAESFAWLRTRRRRLDARREAAHA